MDSTTTLTADDILGSDADAIFGAELRSGKPARVQRSGDFHRHSDGRPRVAHPTELIKDGSRGRWVYYARPSGIGHGLENDYALRKWGERRLVFGTADPNVHQMAQALHDHPIDSPEWRTLADKAVVHAMRAGKAMEAAEQGTHMHSVTEDDDLPDAPDNDERDPIARIEAGEDLGIPRHVQMAMLAAWRRMLDEYGIEILAVELTVVHDEWGQAGTLDRIGILTRPIAFDFNGATIILPAGTVVVLDLKTGKIRFDGKTGKIKFWRSYVLQVGCYAASVIYDVTTDTRAPYPWPVSQNWAIIAHLPVDEALAGHATCRLVLVDIATGIEVIGSLVMPINHWQQRTDLLGLTHPDEPVIDIEVDLPAAEEVNEPMSMPTVEADPMASCGPADSSVGGARDGLRVATDEPRMVTVDSTDAFDGLVLGETSHWDQRGTDVYRRFLIARIKNLAETPTALAEFIARMEELRIPRMSKCDTHTNRQLRTVEQELVRVECRHGIQVYAVTTPPLDLPDEGRDLTDDETASLVKQYKALDQTRRVAVDVWANEALRAGFAVHMSQRQTERRRANLLARIACSDPELDPELVRAGIAHVTREDWPHMPGIPVGACFGALTIDEANRLAALAPRLGELPVKVDRTGAVALDVAA